MEATDTIKVTVAPRRSVVVTAVVDHHWVAGQRMPIFGPKTCGPGEVVHVAADEVGLLIARGFVLDPAQSELGKSIDEAGQSTQLEASGEAA